MALEGNSKVLPFIIIQWQQSPVYFGCNAHQVQVNKLLVAANHCKPRSLFSIYHDLILPKKFWYQIPRSTFQLRPPLQKHKIIFEPISSASIVGIFKARYNTTINAFKSILFTFLYIYLPNRKKNLEEIVRLQNLHKV